ncbi:MAG: Mrr restriction system protein, partial [uncultured Chloroflexia bacterium]
LGLLQRSQAVRRRFAGQGRAHRRRDALRPDDRPRGGRDARSDLRDKAGGFRLLQRGV